MSRIKMLLAEEESIDDLKVPTRFGKDLFDTITEADNKTIAETVLRWSKSMKSEDYIADNAEFGLGDDDGEPCMFLENFTSLCDDIAQENLDKLIVQEHLDLSDKDYADILDKASALIANFYADYEDALCADAFADYKGDVKYTLMNLKERNGEC